MESSGKLIQRVFLAVSGSVPPIVLAVLLLKIWIAPYSVDNGGWIKLAASIVLLEFLLLHSGAFMAVGPLICPKRWQRLGWFVGFGLFYFGSIFAFGHWTGGNYVTGLLVAVVISRLLTLVVFHDKRGTILIFQRSAFGMVLLILTCLVLFLPLPGFGLTPEIISSNFGSADDMFSKYPQRTLAWGMIYFLLMGILELFLGWYLPDWTDEQVEETWDALGK